MKPLFFFIGILWFCISCDINENKSVETKPQLIIYDDQKYSTIRKPIAIANTSDGGYVILCTTENADSDFPGCYLMKTDKEGKFVKDTLLATDIVAPYENLISTNGRVYFLAMDNLTLEARIINLSEDLSNLSEFRVSETTYPLSLNWEATTNSFLLQCYNRDDARTELFRLNTNGSIAQRRNLSVGAGEFNLEKTIIEHFTGLNKRLPFLMGRTPEGTYYFNGFFRYTFSLTFFGFNTQTPGVLQGYRDNRGIATVWPKGGDLFALSRFGQGNMAYIPNVTLNTNTSAVASSGDLQGYFIPEIENYTRVLSIAVPTQNPQTLYYASANRKGQLALYQYSYQSGQYQGTAYLGQGGSYEIGGICQSADGGIAVAATVYLAGRIPKVALFLR